MKVSITQKDTLSEVFNIGMSRAATNLSEIIKQEVHLTVPSIDLVDPIQLPQALQKGYDDLNIYNDTPIIFTDQDLNGGLEGKAFLIYTPGARALIISAVAGNVDDNDLKTDELKNDAISEISNIIIATCISTLSRLLPKEIILTTPCYKEGIILDIVTSIGDISGHKETTVLVIKVGLHFTKSDIRSTMLLAFTVATAEALLRGLDDLLKGRVDL